MGVANNGKQCQIGKYTPVHRSANDGKQWQIKVAVCLLWSGEYSHNSTDLQLFVFFGQVNILIIALICNCLSSLDR